MDMLFGILLLVVFGAVAWCAAAEGPWGAPILFFCVLFSGLLAMNFFEVTAPFLERLGRVVAPFADFVSLVGLFALFTFLMRLGTENLAPTQIELDPRLSELIRWPFALACGYVTVGILLTAIHTAPLPREFLGFRPEARNFLDISAPDREWLGFTQYVSEEVLWSGRVFDGPVGKIEGTDQQIWPSFPIRYAVKRQDYAGGRKAKTAPPPSSSVPPSGGVPGGGQSSF